MSNILIRKVYLVNGNNRLISCYDSGYNFRNFKIKLDCEKMCKIECNFKYYRMEIVRIENIFQKNVIDIRHNEYPDIFVKHIPETTLIDFVCNFGGLLGIWLGLSFFSVVNNIFEIITKTVYRKYVMILIEKCKHC